jgi:presenilin-like A22 family membrane protease
MFVPPFEVTILNHSPRLILAVPSKVSVQKNKILFLIFIFDPTWYITDVTGPIMMQNYVHAIAGIVFESYFFGCSHTPSAELIAIIDFFIRINKNVFTIGIKRKVLLLPIPLTLKSRY